MAFYAVQVWTGDEERFRTLADRTLAVQRRGCCGRGGACASKRADPGATASPRYFPATSSCRSNEFNPDIFIALKKTPGFVRFLPSNENAAPLDRADQELLNHFLAFGEIVAKSTAYFDENKRIRIVAGPLKNLEGMIVRVDRRKGRARVRLEMYEDSFEVDFGFEALEAAPVSPSGS